MDCSTDRGVCDWWLVDVAETWLEVKNMTSKSQLGHKVGPLEASSGRIGATGKMICPHTECSKNADMMP